jgi:iron complex outermembrane receptor protein
MNIESLRKQLAGAVAVILSMAGGGAVHAAGSDATASADTGTLEEVVVTARRRSEDVQTVPISVSDITAADLEVRGITNVESLTHAIVNFSPAPGSFDGLEQASFRIRGLPNVGVYLDGVAHQENFGFFGELIEMNNVEVLRGPQGTLFGKNSLAGAVQYVTKLPADTFGVRLSTTVGDYNRFDVSGSADIPLSPTLLTKLTLAKVTRDGYLASTTVNQNFGSVDNTVGRVDVLWKPTDQFNWRFIVEQDDIGTNGNASTLWGLTFNCAGNPPSPACVYNGAAAHGEPQLAVSPTSLYGLSQQWKTAENYNGPETFTDATNYTTILNYEFNSNWSAKGIGSYRNLSSENYEDYASIGVNMFAGENTNIVDETTGEVQLQFNSDRFTGTTGVYYYKDYRRWRRNNWFNNELDLAVNPANNAALNAFLATLGQAPVKHFGPGNKDGLFYYFIHGIAGYSEWTWKATDQLSLTAGVRYNRDSNDTISYKPAQPIPALCCVPSTSLAPASLNGPPVDVVYTNTAPRVSLQYQWTPAVMTYITYSEGFNAGGGSQATFNGVPQVVPYAPETLKNFEVGLRSELFDRSLLFNTSLFYSQYDNVQVTEDINFVAVTANAGKGKSKGVEVESKWLATRYFSVNLNLGYLDTHLTEVPVGSGITPGQSLPFAPKFSATVGMQYDQPLPGGAGLTFRADEGYTTGVNTGVDSSSVYIPGYGLLSARVIYQPADSHWNAQVFGTNLTDKFYRLDGYNIAADGNLNLGSVGLPRMWGATFNYKF